MKITIDKNRYLKFNADNFGLSENENYREVKYSEVNSISLDFFVQKTNYVLTNIRFNIMLGLLNNNTINIDCIDKNNRLSNALKANLVNITSNKANEILSFLQPKIQLFCLRYMLSQVSQEGLKIGVCTIHNDHIEYDEGWFKKKIKYIPINDVSVVNYKNDNKNYIQVDNGKKNKIIGFYTNSDSNGIFIAFLIETLKVNLNK